MVPVACVVGAPLSDRPGSEVRFRTVLGPRPTARAYSPPSDLTFQGSVPTPVFIFAVTSIHLVTSLDIYDSETSIHKH